MWIMYSWQSIRVVECPEFRKLLLYACPEIKDSDLAKRDRIYNMIVSESVEFLEALTKQLKVCQCFNP
jgi:hypothetical protein